MTEENPYEIPEAELEQEPAEQEFALAATPRSMSGDRGLAWITEGFSYFKKSWGAWIGALLLGFVILIVVSLIPYVGQLFEMATYYVWIAGLALGCRAQAQGQPFKVSHLWAGFPIMWVP